MGKTTLYALLVISFPNKLIPEIGQLFIWGWNDKAQLGISGQNIPPKVLIPSLVILPEIVEFGAAGYEHTIVITSKHIVIYI